MGTPKVEIQITETLVRRLLQEQTPEHSEEPIRYFDRGWDNFTYRLGQDYAVRLPCRKAGVELIEREQNWLPEISKKIPLKVPAPVFSGSPSKTYPWPWSIVPWLEGKSLDNNSLPPEDANRFVEFLRALHIDAPSSAPTSENRGIPIERKKTEVAAQLQTLKLETPHVTNDTIKIWEDSLKCSASSERKWLHGDLHSRNVVVQDGRLAGVIDWGDLCAGDVATDLASVWFLFESAETREKVLQDYGADPQTIQRAKGWAISLAAVLLITGREDHPVHEKMGIECFRRISC